MDIYFDSITDYCGYIHSIDMVYVEYYSSVSKFDYYLDILHDIRDKYKLEYYEVLDKKPSSKYEFYNNMVNIGGVNVQFGKYTDYDRTSKLFRLLPMLKIRINPNKYYSAEWFQELYTRFKGSLFSGYLVKYDYAIDIPVSLDSVQVFGSRKEYKYIKSTRYYGQSGNHGMCKIYNKQKELLDKGYKDVPVITRVEYTLRSGRDPSLEKVYVLSSDQPEVDYSKLKDTDKAIIEMYLKLQSIGEKYDLKLGRRKMLALAPYFSGSYKLLDYGDILSRLLKNMAEWFDAGSVPVPASDPVTDPDDLIQLTPEEAAEISELFG